MGRRARGLNWRYVCSTSARARRQDMPCRAVGIVRKAPGSRVEKGNLLVFRIAVIKSNKTYPHPFSTNERSKDIFKNNHPDSIGMWIYRVRRLPLRLNRLTRRAADFQLARTQAPQRRQYISPPIAAPGRLQRDDQNACCSNAFARGKQWFHGHRPLPTPIWPR